MTDRLKETIETYERTAESMAEYFRSINGARKEDVDKAFELLDPQKQNPFVLEIGCADGRDAAYIMQKTDRYIGFDPIKKFIEMAKQNISNAEFLVADARTYEYPNNLDIVFAFASLLHLSKEECSDVFQKVAKSLNPGGIFYISLKKGDQYESYFKDDKYGRRLFYLYNPDIIKEIAGPDYETVFIGDSGFVTTDNSEWFEIALGRK